jgi:hypothetical protein
MQACGFRNHAAVQIARMKPAPLVVVRALTTVVTSAIWWILLYVAGWLFTIASKVDHPSPLLMANLTAISYLFVPYFATEGVLMSMLGAHMKQRIVMPAVTEDPKARPTNPWLLSLIHVAIFGVVPAILGYMVSIRAAPDSLTPSQFAVNYAWGGTGICALVAWYVSGRPFLKQVRVPRASRPFAGTVNQYLWPRYILPHGISNFFINGALAFALAPAATAEAGVFVPAEQVIVDLVITFLVLTCLVSSGAKSMARAETEWGVATRDFTADLHMPAAFLPTFFSGLGLAIVLGISFAIFDVDGMGVTTWAVFRAVIYGAYCGWVAKRCAQASINETFHPEIIVRTRPLPKASPKPAAAAPLEAESGGIAPV